MAGRLGRAAGRVGLAALAVSALVAGWPVSSEAAPPVPRVVAVPASALSDGYRFDLSTTYTLDPPGRAVHVAIDMTLTNQRPDEVVGSQIRQYYLPNFSVPVLAEAVGLSAVKSDGTVLPVSVEGTESPRFSVATIDLRPDIYHPSSQTLRLTYDIPPQPPRSDAFTRLNDAYATFPVLALGDPGLADVEVVVPEGFEVELVGNEMVASERDGSQVFSATDVQAPLDWGVLVSARDDSKLLERVVDLGDEEVKVLAWPGDDEWADFAATQVEKGVPAIEALTGLEWPVTATIEVVETASPYLYGYAGWYVRSDALIEVGDELDQQVMLHELAHIWFNDRLFDGRWINEAFANQISALAMAELGEEQPRPERIDPNDPGHLKLNDWSDPDLQAEVSDDQERYGYNASWGVLNAIADEIGPERLAEVIQAADAGHVAYRGPGDPEELIRIFDWEELLDLLEEVGGSTTATDLFRRHVVSESESADFEARAVAREHYAELVEQGDGWAAPTSIRLAMTDWRFDTAEDLMTVAGEVLATKAELVEVVADLEVSEDLALRQAYEEGKDIGELAEEAEHALAAAEDLQSAEDAEADGAGPLGAIGLLLSGPGDDLDRARDAFDAGDYDGTQAAATAVESTMDGAAMAGVLRILALLAVVLAAFGARALLRRRRVRRATARVDEPPASDDAVAVTVVAPAAAPEGAGLEADGAEGVGGPADGGGEGGV